MSDGAANRGADGGTTASSGGTGAAGPAPDSASATGERAPLCLVVGGARREELRARLDERGIQLNDSARTLLEDPCFDTRAPEKLEVVQRSLQQLGLASGGTLPQITAAAREQGLAPLPPDTGPYLRLAITDQEQAPDSILSAGRAPTGAVHVHSAPLRADHDYPKGFYLRVVDGVTWLRGYRCDDEYVWLADAVLALRHPAVPSRGRSGPDHRPAPFRP